MKLETFFDNFEMLAESPNGVQKLRELILELAVRGKLVDQDEKDEPASILLERIIVERKKLVKEGKVKESGKFPIENENAPFELPSIWKWTCLYEIGLINPRNIAEDDKEVSFIPMTLISETSIKPIDSEKRRWGEVKKGFTHFAEGDIVLAKITPCFQNGKSAVMRGLINNLGAGTTELHVFRPILNESVIPEYVLLYLRSPQFLSEGIEKMTGTAGQKRVPKDYFAGNPFPLPPFEEQARIVAKVDQLMSLCDELEARQQKKRESRAHINSAALYRLLAARVPGEFTEGWRRINDNFDLLYDAPENVGALRQAILRLAILGKLLTQDDGDEPAEKLLARILVERRAKLEKNLCSKGKDPKKAKYHETLSPNMDGLPSIPRSWKWVSWETILDHENGGFRRGPFGSTLTKSIFVESGYKVYEQYCPINNDCSFGRYFITPEKFEELKSFEVRAGDYLVSCSGSLGRITRVPQEFERGIINQALLRVRINDRIVSHLYFLHLFRSPFFQELLVDNSTGTAITNVKGVKDLKAIPIPLPPLHEQTRIVAKLDQLMSLCDELEAGLMRSQADSEKLMEAVVGGMLAG